MQLFRILCVHENERDLNYKIWCEKTRWENNNWREEGLLRQREEDIISREKPYIKQWKSLGAPVQKLLVL
jgi:hypothetical protein